LCELNLPCFPSRISYKPISSKMKVIKITLLSLFLISISGYIYLRDYYKCTVPGLKSVDMLAFNIKGKNPRQEYKPIAQNISRLPGIASTSVNETSNILAIVFHPDIISENQVAQSLSLLKNFYFEKRALSSSKPGCPVHNIGSKLHWYFNYQ
jgi:hypothetical protein